MATPSSRIFPSATSCDLADSLSCTSLLSFPKEKDEGAPGRKLMAPAGTFG